MGYSITIKKKDGTPYPFRNNIKGSTYAVGEIGYAWMTVTYNYGKIYNPIMGMTIGEMDGKTCEEVKPILQKVLDTLEGEPSDDYWDATLGNARKAIVDFMSMVEACPDGILEIG